MRTRVVMVATALLSGWVSIAAAQPAGQQPGEQPPAVNPWNMNLGNWLDVGARGTSVTGDEARFDRFRDLRTGPFLDRFRYERDTGARLFSFGVDNLGYRDQRFFGQFEVPGKLRISADWNQIPLFFAVGADATGAGGTRSPYSNAGTATQRLPAAIVASVQGLSGAAQQAVLAAVYPPLALPNPFDTRLLRETFHLDLQYLITTPCYHFDMNFNLATARRNGRQPWAVTFGFGETAEVAAPVDTRTTDLTAGLEWSHDGWMVRGSYDGSWFSNAQESLTIDNPIIAADSATAGGSRARYALWPTNHANTVTLAGATRLPAHSHLTATVAFGNWLQDTPLLPMTINSAIAPVTLPRNSAQADIRRITANLSFTTRPARFLDVAARYRVYDFNDETPDFIPPAIVEYDQAVEPGSSELVPAHFSTRYDTFETKATISSLRAVSFAAGYRLNRVNYTDREVSRTSDNAVFASIDSTSLGLVSLHGVYEHARRRAPDFSSFALTALPDAGEYAGLRRYDIADRDRDAATAMLQVMPLASFAVSGSITVARDKFPNLQWGPQDAFGLENRKSQGYAIFFDATPRDTVTFGAGYGFQKYSSLQQSRQVNLDPTTPAGGAQQIDPNRDWTVAEEDEKVHYISANAEFAQLVPKTALRVIYDYNRSDSPYAYAAGSTLPTPAQLPPVQHRWHTAILDLRYFIQSNLAAGFTYRYDRYIVSDFALGGQVEDHVVLPGVVLLGYGFRPYTANSFWVRVLWLF